MLKIPRPEKFSSFVKGLPAEPGIYKFKDPRRKSVYIGKAKNLKNRLKSYLSNSEKKSGKYKQILSDSSYLDLILTRNELESLLLEQHLIKQEKPKYNIQFKDDKGYPWIEFQVSKKYPPVKSYLGRRNKKDIYFGPYPSSYSVKNFLDLIQKVFKLRDCSDSFFKNRKRPCLQFEIGKCSAPCVGFISEKQYLKELEEAKRFLLGNSEDLVKDLYRLMDESSKSKLYEKAASYRDKISALREIQRTQSTSGFLKERDAISISKYKKVTKIGLTEVRKGWIVSHKNFTVNNSLKESTLVENFISSHYLNIKDMPSNIVTSEKLVNKVILEKALSKFHKRRIRIIAKPGKKDQGLLEISQSNTNFSFSKLTKHERNLTIDFLEIEKFINSRHRINRIEGIDISHQSGKNAVGSCVVFDINGSRNKDYRLYNISENNMGNDIGSMIEVISRRYISSEKEKSIYPDLLILDGGYTHLKAVKRELKKLKITSIYLIALVKGSRRKKEFDSLIKENGETIRVNKILKSHLLLQEIRDESHRFSINNVRSKMKREIKKSSIDKVIGIGNVNKTSLLRYFGDLEQIKKASVEDLGRVKGIGKKKASDIFNYFHVTR